MSATRHAHESIRKFIDRTQQNHNKLSRIKGKIMGIGLPMVGYVAATSHGTDLASKPNQNKLAEVDTFVGLVRIAFLDGWSDALLPSGMRFTSDSQSPNIPQKNFEHKIFFESDLEKRPELNNAIEFLKSDPAGGCLCVISIDDITKPTGYDIQVPSPNGREMIQQRVRSIEQCFAIRELEFVPILECGRRSDHNSLVNKFAHAPRKSNNPNVRSNIIRELIMGALATNSAHTKRLEHSKQSCILGRRDQLSELEKEDYLRNIDLNLACKRCIEEM